MKKTLTILGVVLFLVILLLLFANPNGKEDELKAEFKTTDVLQGDLFVKISATGVVEPNFKVEVKSKASGEVLKFPFEEGDPVRKGQLLLELDKTDEKRKVAKANAELASATAKLKKAETALLLQRTKYDTDLRTARSELEAAEANFQEAQDKLKRQRDLFERKFISQEALDAAVTSYAVNREKVIQSKAQLQAAQDAVHDITLKENEIELARSEVDRARISLDEAKERLSETEISAPISGIVIQKLVEEGQIIASGISNVSGGTPLMTVADMSRLFIIADVDETDIGSVRVQQKVKITADAFPSQEFEGTVTRIAPQGEVENSITIFKVKIEIVGAGKNNLKPMMSANIEIVTASAPNAVHVSRGAIRTEGDEPFVVLLKAGQPTKVPVTLGIENPIHSQIVSGVEPGDKVVLGDWEKLVAEAEQSQKKGSALRKILWMIRSK